VRYLSVCSGIEAVSVALRGMGWECAGLSDIDKACNAVLRYHYPDVTNYGDFTKIQKEDIGTIDLLVGGTPCQDFSVAGLRAGVAGARGNLTLEFLRLAGRLEPRWVVWENVPGVLSIDSGRTFGAVLGALAELGYGIAYRVLDAQWFGVPQRRRRVFVVGYLGDWRRAAAVLFERESVLGNPPPRREAGKRVAPCLDARTTAGGQGWGTDFMAGGGLAAQRCFGGNRTGGEIEVATACRAKGGTGHGDFESETFVAFDVKRDLAPHGSVAPREQIGPLTATDYKDAPIVAFSAKDYGADAAEDVAPVLRAMGHDKSHANAGGQVAVAFKPSHFTRGKDGAPSETTPPLSADADKGDQDTLVLPVPQAVSLRGREGGATAELGGETATAVRASQGGGDKGHVLTPTFQNTGQGWWNESETEQSVRTPCGGDSVKANLALSGMAVRRLIPRECERLQGFPDDYTLVPYGKKPMADGPRYKMIGNSMAVPCMRWIFRRIAEVDMLTTMDSDDNDKEMDMAAKTKKKNLTLTELWHLASAQDARRMEEVAARLIEIQDQQKTLEAERGFTDPDTKVRVPGIVDELAALLEGYDIDGLVIDDFTVGKQFNAGRPYLDKLELLNLGVDPMLIEKAMKRGAAYTSVVCRKTGSETH